MGMRRRTRRRGLVAGAIAGGAIAHHRNKQYAQDQAGQVPVDDGPASMRRHQQTRQTRSSTLRSCTPRVC